MSNARIIKKLHSRYLADFIVEASQDPEWAKKMHDLSLEDKLDTAELGFPEFFAGFFPEVGGMELKYSIERINLADIPRSSSCWWPIEKGTSYFVAYPSEFPQTTVYMAIDFDCGHEH